jgi:hypothetical protein
MPQRLVIDQTLSYARRDGTDIELVLHVAETDGFEPPASLVLRRRKRFLDLPVEAQVGATGAVLHARVPAKDLRGREAWQLRLPDEAAAHGSRPLPVRLLAKRRMPVALIVGPRPATRLPEPTPRPPQPPASRPLAARLAEAGKRRAVRVRQTVRSRRTGS